MQGFQMIPGSLTAALARPTYIHRAGAYKSTGPTHAEPARGAMSAWSTLN